ncbi:MULTISPECIES: hypothetical protein [unclassified Endozoicomonas]|uniref:hypothetical protein n=1 Tax=unclassified Endozoicomonas TaxID=2644528 RepID=UPI00214882E7|nr:MULTISPECIES: hypothetical protein [unclassified Endozoicomonas]
MISINTRLKKLVQQSGSLDEMIEYHRQALKWLYNDDDEHEEYIVVTSEEAKASFEIFWKDWAEAGLPAPARLRGPSVADLIDLHAAKLWGPQHSIGSSARKGGRY